MNGMLAKPDLSEATLLSQLERDYSLTFIELEFLPLGADRNTAVYRATSEEGSSYFVKLRRGTFDEASVALPYFFSEHGVEHIITPLVTTIGQPWSTLEAFTIVLYPFIKGEDGYKLSLTEENWRDFGRTLRRLHTLDIPEALTRGLRRETYSAATREAVKALFVQLETTSFVDRTAEKTAQFLRNNKHKILELVGHAESYAHILKGRSLEPVLCHDDLHAGNLLIGSRHDFYIVDWDSPILAPKERDLMFIGGGLGFKGFSPQEEETLFYKGYGIADIDLDALAYYRLERILRDVEAYGDELVRELGSQEERELSLHYLKSNFEPGSTIERAYAVMETHP